MPPSHLIEYAVAAEEADLALRIDDKESLRYWLMHVFAVARTHGLINFHGWRSARMAQLCVQALALEIEVEYVQRLIRRRALILHPSEVPPEFWPFPLKVYTLGRFFIVRDGQPDAEGDAAANLFKITLHRLRKLLSHDNAVEFAEGRLSLNAKMFWVDSWSLARVLGQAPGAETVDRALAFYRGHFLELESANNNAIVRYREQLSGRVLGALKLQIDSCESRQEWESVLNYSTRALTLDDHDEDLHCAAIPPRTWPHAEVLACLRARQAMLYRPPTQLQMLIQTRG